MNIPLKSFQIAEKANVCGCALVPGETIDLKPGVRQMGRITLIGAIGMILVERGEYADLVSTSHVIKAAPLDTAAIADTLLGKPPAPEKPKK